MSSDPTGVVDWMKAPSGKRGPPLGFDLLDALEAFVREKPPLKDFTGSISIGIRTELRDRWWNAVFKPDRTPSREIAPRPTLAAAAVLLLGEDEANAILRTGKLPAAPKLVRFDGDRKLIERFLDGYLPSDVVRGPDAEL